VFVNNHAAYARQADRSEADDAMEIIQGNHMQRGLELEALALEARQEYERALAERGGN
jgi:hypothetical protein